MLIDVRYSDAGVSAMIERLSRAVADPTPAHAAIGEYVLGRVDEGFENESAPDGTPWKPLSRYTIEKKKKEGKILKILQRTGFMRASANYRADPSGVSVGFSDPKAAEHQATRPLVGLSEADGAAIVDIYGTFLNGEGNP